MKRLVELVSPFRLMSLDSLMFFTASITIVLLGIYYWYIPIFMALWMILWIITVFLKKKIFLNVPAKYVLLYLIFLLFYGWQICGMLYTSNLHEGFRNLVLRISLFIFPLILIQPGEIIRRKATFLIRLFAFSTFAYMIFCFGFALFRSFQNNNGVFVFNPHPPAASWLNYFYGSYLAIFHHPSYLSMFLLLSAYIMLEQLFNNRSLAKRILLFAILVVILISIYFLSSRAAILTIFISFPLYLLFRYLFNRFTVRSLIWFLIPMFIFIPVFLTNPRLKRLLNDDSNPSTSEVFMNESRIVMWKAGINIIKKNLIFGVGTGDIQDELNKEYTNTQLIKANETSNFNTHNQFIEVMAENGLIGIILFLILFLQMIYISLSERNVIYFVFTTIIIVSFCFETMLNRLAGVSFFSLFSFLLLYSGKEMTVPVNE